MKNSIFNFSLLCLFILSSCNNQPAKRQNPDEVSSINNESKVISNYLDQEDAQIDENSENISIVSPEEMEKLSKGAAKTSDFEKINTLDHKETTSMTVEERENARAAAIEKRRQREEAQRARAIARAEKTGDQATIRQETSRPSTVSIQQKNTPLNKEDMIPESTRKQLEQRDIKNKQLMDETNAILDNASSIKAEAERPVVDHSDWDYLLRKHVSKTGIVDYRGFKADMKSLEKYLKQLRNYPPAKTWSREENMAYWINAYNAFTIKLILDNYPLSSITKLDEGKPWDKAWIKLGTKTYTLNNIENDILRPNYKDARIHFAVNCAAASCPPLLNRAWTAENMERHFQNQTRSFINNAKHNTISPNNIEVSKIFEWYAVDFGDLIEFLNKYSDTKINAGAKITYKEYDWDLNE